MTMYFSEVCCFLTFHSNYKGFMIYRQYNPVQDRHMMSYYGIQWVNPDNVQCGSKFKVCVHAKNLDGIKKAITGAKI